MKKYTILLVICGLIMTSCENLSSSATPTTTPASSATPTPTTTPASSATPTPTTAPSASTSYEIIDGTFSDSFDKISYIFNGSNFTYTSPSTSGTSGNIGTWKRNSDNSVTFSYTGVGGINPTSNQGTEKVLTTAQTQSLTYSGAFLYSLNGKNYFTLEGWEKTSGSPDSYIGTYTRSITYTAEGQTPVVWTFTWTIEDLTNTQITLRDGVQTVKATGSWSLTNMDFSYRRIQYNGKTYLISYFQGIEQI